MPQRKKDSPLKIIKNTKPFSFINIATKVPEGDAESCTTNKTPPQVIQLEPVELIEALNKISGHDDGGLDRTQGLAGDFGAYEELDESKSLEGYDN